MYSRVATASTPSSPNATSAALQQKLDGGDVVTVGPDPVGQAAWLVGQPLLFQRSHQRVVFLPGTLIWAANDTFHGRSDSLFTIGAHPQRLAPGVPGPPSLTNLSIVGYGAVWRMRRKDYAKTSADKSNGWYSVSEYRNGLTVQGCSDVTIEGITIQETGGDGIYVNTVWNVTLRRVLVDGAYRNGVSVIAADGLLVEHSILRNTRGTDPECGAFSREFLALLRRRYRWQPLLLHMHGIFYTCASLMSAWHASHIAEQEWTSSPTRVCQADASTLTSSTACNSPTRRLTTISVEGYW